WRLAEGIAEHGAFVCLLPRSCMAWAHSCSRRYAKIKRYFANSGSRRSDADWKLQVFTLEVTSDGGRTRDANDYVLKRSAEERSHCYRRKLLQFARPKAANEARGSTCGVSSKNSRADYQQAWTRAVGVLHLLR